MNASGVPTVPTLGRPVGTVETQQNKGCSDCSDRSDPASCGRSKKNGSLRGLVERWERQQGERAEVSSVSTRDVYSSSPDDRVFSPPLSPLVGTVGTVGTGPENVAFGRSDLSRGESEQSEQWIEGEPEQWVDLGRDLTWADVPSKAMVAGLLAGYRLRPRKA